MPESINELLERESFCGTILITKADKIIFEKGYGIANHTLQIPNSSNVVYRIGSVAKHVTALCMLQLQKPMYSNVGYSILGHLIEIGSYYTYSEYISKYICQPLGLFNTGTDVNKYCAITNRSYGYEGGEINKHMLFKMYEGAGSIFYTTANDFRKWDKALYSNILISEQYKELMFKCHETINDHTGYGYGWEVNRLAPTIHQHAGHVAGICSFVILNIDTKFLMFAVSNRGEEGLKPINLINDKIIEWIM